MVLLANPSRFWLVVSCVRLLLGCPPTAEALLYGMLQLQKKVKGNKGLLLKLRK